MTADDKKPRDPGCKCHWEEGDSPCPVHGDESNGPTAWTPEIKGRLARRVAYDVGPDRDDLAAALAELDRRGADIYQLTSGDNNLTARAVVAAQGAELQKRGEERERMVKRIAEIEADNERIQSALSDSIAGPAAQRAMERIETALQSLGSEYTAPAGWEDRVHEAVEASKILHPNGRCTCHGEGRCAWCVRSQIEIEATEAERERIRHAVEAMPRKHGTTGQLDFVHIGQVLAAVKGEEVPAERVTLTDKGRAATGAVGCQCAFMDRWLCPVHGKGGG